MAKRWTRDEMIAIAEREAAKYGLPAGTVPALMEQESGFNVMAKGRQNKKGERAEGVMQIWSTNSKSAGIDPYDPAQAIPYGVKLLGQYTKQFGGSITDGLTAYNWGPANLRKFYAGTRKDIPSEAQKYAAEITARMPKFGGSVGANDPEAIAAKYGMSTKPGQFARFAGQKQKSNPLTPIATAPDEQDDQPELSIEDAVASLQMSNPAGEQDDSIIAQAFGSPEEEGSSILESLIKKEVEVA